MTLVIIALVGAVAEIAFVLILRYMAGRYGK